MPNPKTFTKNYALCLYFLLTFLISWGVITLLIGVRDVINPWATPGELLPAVVMAVLTGPLVSGLLMTGITKGRGGFSNLLSRLTKWKLNIRWYSALLIAPLSLSVTILLLAQFSSAYLPTSLTDESRQVSLAFTFIGAILGGLMEEIGWTGFAIPRMLRRFSVLKTGLVLGFIWGAWHFLPNLWGSAHSTPDAPLALFLAVSLFSFLPPYRILMVWVYERTRSVLLAVLMHTSLIFFWLSFMPATLTGMQRIICFLVWASFLWLLVAAVNKFSGNVLLRRVQNEES